MTRLDERVARTIERYRMFAGGQRVGVAVSGGADSVCLLYLLAELAPRWNLRLSVLHLDHKLRGEESRADARFVACLAAKLGLDATIREADVGAVAGNLEQTAREARLGFFRDRIAGGAVDRVATGHTRSDQAETVLFRFLRGAGSAGLSGIRPVTSDGVVRPLLDVERAETEEYLRTRGIPWRRDQTNADLRFARNRIRHELLPELKREWNPRIGDALAHTADWARAEEEWWVGEILRLSAPFQRQAGAVVVPADQLRSLPLAVARRLVRQVIEEVKGDLRGIDFEHVGRILALAARPEGNGSVQAPGLRVRRSLDWLCFALLGETADYRMAVKPPEVVAVPGTRLRLSLEIIEMQGSPEVVESVYNCEMGCVDWGRLSGSLELRNWRPGDRYQPLGSAIEIKVKNLFQTARIPYWERSRWPILTDGGSIVWARRFGPAVGFAAKAGTKVILAIRESEV